MDESQLFESLRTRGIDADDPEIRAAVRTVTAHVADVARRHDPHHARRCMEAMQAALAYQLAHPDVGDMSSFEAAYDEDE